METVLQAIDNLGFPIVICIIFVYGIKYMFDKFMDKSEQESEKHAEEVKAMTDALNNNTLVLQKLCDKLDGVPSNEEIDLTREPTD